LAPPGVALSVLGDTSLTVSAPAHAPGTVYLIITGPVGVSTLNRAASFTFTSSIPGPQSPGPGSTTGGGGGQGQPTLPVTTQTYNLTFRWNLVVWAGADGTTVRTALSGGNVFQRVTAIFRWDSNHQVWQAYFPGSDGVPGANDFSSFTHNMPYWVAIDNQ